MIVKKIDLSTDAVIFSSLSRNDYSDVFSISFPSAQAIPVEKLPIHFFNAVPKWFGGLLMIRETIAKWIGLKTATEMDVNQQMANFKGEVGESIGLFNVMDKTATELMSGENDKHLDFRLSFFSTRNAGNNEIALATTVQFNNWLGKVYFLPVKPIHRIIVPILLKRMAKQIQENEQAHLK